MANDMQKGTGDENILGDTGRGGTSCSFQTTGLGRDCSARATDCWAVADGSGRPGRAQRGDETGTARARMGRSEPAGQLCLEARTLLGCGHTSERAQVEHSRGLAFRKFSENKKYLIT